jgi:hypothetical protein
MKKTILLFAVLLIPIFGFTQTMENIDYISTFNEDVAAIQKNNQWAFINKQGVIVIDFRDDLVITEFKDGNYPIFKNERCLIQLKKEGNWYFGYIDKKGKTVIEPQFLNATNFENNTATVLKLTKENAGKNTALGKNIVYYKYFEVTIDTNGNVKDYLTTEGVNVVIDNGSIKNPPKINSKQISDHIYAVQNENKKWSIKVIQE